MYNSIKLFVLVYLILYIKGITSAQCSLTCKAFFALYVEISTDTPAGSGTETRPTKPCKMLACVYLMSY